MAIVDHRLGSFDKDTGPQAGNGKILLYVLEVASQDEAEQAAYDGGFLPGELNGFLRGKVAVNQQSTSMFFIDADYSRGIPGSNDQTAGQSPGGQTTPGMDPNTALHRDVSFSATGATKKIFLSKETLFSGGAGSSAAPDFKRLIGVDVMNNKVEGCEVLSPTCDISITRKFPFLSVGWFRNALSSIGTTNDSPYIGMDEGELLLKGMQGNYKDGDTATLGGVTVSAPWTVTAQIGFSANKTFGENPDELTIEGIDGDIEIPFVDGWNYVWVMYRTQEQTISVNGANQKYTVPLPAFAYVERVYDDSPFDLLDMDPFA